MNDKRESGSFELITLTLIFISIVMISMTYPWSGRFFETKKTLGTYSNSQSCEEGFDELKKHYGEEKIRYSIFRVFDGKYSPAEFDESDGNMKVSDYFSMFYTGSEIVSNEDIRLIRAGIKGGMFDDYRISKVFGLESEPEKCYVTFVNDVKKPETEYVIVGVPKNIRDYGILERYYTIFEAIDKSFKDEYEEMKIEAEKNRKTRNKMEFLKENALQ